MTTDSKGPRDDISEILKNWSEGDQEALERLMPLVVDELRRVARNFFRGEPAGHTLQPTALVNEAVLRLLGPREVSWQNRAQFFGFIAQLMRRVLVDHARKRRAEKRGGDVCMVPLDDIDELAVSQDVDLLALDGALEALAKFDPIGSRIVELRFFGGLSQREVAETLSIPLIQARRRWTAAKLWLYRELSGE